MIQTCIVQYKIVPFVVKSIFESMYKSSSVRCSLQTSFMYEDQVRSCIMISDKVVSSLLSDIYQFSVSAQVSVQPRRRDGRARRTFSLTAQLNTRSRSAKESFWKPGRVSGKNITICSAVTQHFLWKSNWNAELEVLFVQAVQLKKKEAEIYGEQYTDRFATLKEWPQNLLSQ